MHFRPCKRQSRHGSGHGPDEDDRWHIRCEDCHMIEKAIPQPEAVITPLDESEQRFVKEIQKQHPEFTITEIEEVVRRCALALALGSCREELRASVKNQLGID